MSTIPEKHAVQEFSDYLVDNYISDEGLFPPHIWASDMISSQKTTNACESFHAKFNKSFSSPHPNIFEDAIPTATEYGVYSVTE
ncbi:Uncharacterized protein FWK35_00007815 [Aphis craccivora]|uniref:MULE domain-containing protein n=1 Tax=Aphis craccivora TaxID=307492 RepID=A0A6G0ZHC5_APHCR|nr:Uncharacterized protein FWK35_00007815 [Aphis craccivora]